MAARDLVFASTFVALAAPLACGDDSNSQFSATPEGGAGTDGGGGTGTGGTAGGAGAGASGDATVGGSAGAAGDATVGGSAGTGGALGDAGSGFCGDGVTDFAAGEQCDDRNRAGGDRCDMNCQIEPPPNCGNGVIDVADGEECDDGPPADNDGCDSSCQLEFVGQTCGDTVTDALEKCDPPEQMPADGDGCNATCNLSGVVTTLATGVNINGLTSDNQYLWAAIGDCQNPTACGIGRVDIAACIAAPTTAACQPTFVTGGSGRCSCSAALADGDPATATFDGMNAMTTDGSTIWFANRHTIREYDIASGVVTTVAGNAGSCGAIDGNRLGAYFHDIRGLTYYNGLVYSLDGCENVLRSYDPATGDVVTIAGTRHLDPTVTQQPPYTCVAGFSCVDGTPTPGVGLNADFGSPRYMTADNAGNLYIVDTNGQAIWRYNTVTRAADILFSGGAPGHMVAAYSDGDAAAANIGRPRGIVSDGTSLYFAEQNYATIRQTVLSNDMTSTFVGAMGCAASLVMQAPADGLGADTTQLWCQGGGAPPAGVPVFDTSLGAMSFNFQFRSIFLVDGQNLRRVE